MGKLVVSLDGVVIKEVQITKDKTTLGRRPYNDIVIDNLAVSRSDYDPYCIKAPTDARLPGGGGAQVCGLYDITPAKFNQVNNLVTKASNFGKQRRVNAA